MRTRMLLAIGLLLLASAAHAQAPFPGAVKIGDGWVPCDHPLAIQAGLGCVQAPGQPPYPGAGGTAACLTIQPGPGWVCMNGAWLPCDHPLVTQAGLGCNSEYQSVKPTDLGTRFELGKTYESPYGFRVTIIGTARKTDGTYVFVGEIIKSGGYPKVGDLLSFPCDKDRGAFQFEVPPDQLGSSSPVQ
jgi:hypothetical protein